MTNDPRIGRKPAAVCLHCEATKGARRESAQTAYHYEGVVGSDDDPNRPVSLCRKCAREHHAHWNDMWADYYGGRL